MAMMQQVHQVLIFMCSCRLPSLMPGLMSPRCHALGPSADACLQYECERWPSLAIARQPEKTGAGEYQQASSPVVDSKPDANLRCCDCQSAVYSR
jgi:hypothetical protein